MILEDLVVATVASSVVQMVRLANRVGEGHSDRKAPRAKNVIGNMASCSLCAKCGYRIVKQRFVCSVVLFSIETSLWKIDEKLNCCELKLKWLTQTEINSSELR